MNALTKIEEKYAQGHHICVGLDTDAGKVPAFLRKSKNPIVEFNKIIIDNTFDVTAGFKLNLAFYEKGGARGWDILEETLEYIPADSLTIGDAKRGDIGNTSRMYAEAIYDNLNFDSATLNPYMGIDSVEPFLSYRDKLSFILALTSNSSAADFERILLDDGSYLYQKVIEKVKEWNTGGNCGLVFGATHPDDLRENIGSFEDLHLLLPGIGAQGGNLEEIVGLFAEYNKYKFIINSSRAVIYADDTRNFGKAARMVVENYNKTIKRITKT